MSATLNDGGPAFPSEAVISTAFGELNSSKGTRFTVEGGMSLGDYFAGQALAGLSSIIENRMCPKDRLHDVDAWRDEILLGDADYCYRLADAMLKTRENRKQEGN